MFRPRLPHFVRARLGRAHLAAAMFTALVALPVAAKAEYAYTASGTILRAGPGGGYPAIASLPPGVSLNVYGCLAGWSWCDVDFQGYRGWLYGGSLQYPYQGQRVYLPQYGGVIGLPIITFSFNDYWGRYYRDRPWFADRHRWERLPPPRPIYHPGHDFRPGPGPGRPGWDRWDHHDYRPGPGPGRPGPGPGDHHGGPGPGRPGPGPGGDHRGGPDGDHHGGPGGDHRGGGHDDHGPHH
ncbi:SH3 domain-containing protein [Nitrospirillum bahiense]|uniref:Uncharacterized protein YraI n=1 Tax=Nitrospirillum amazonense TaxID=28077 RepID=A0A560FXU6_9PROT|nr:SH3 domain-containing protein [Nitrospirillum amazonense]TWB26457.1 uncharacterized protein YraI [Nitrospirillum amazonense]